jgi:hypothetical protein
MEVEFIRGGIRVELDSPCVWTLELHVEGGSAPVVVVGRVPGRAGMVFEEGYQVSSKGIGYRVGPFFDLRLSGRYCLEVLSESGLKSKRRFSVLLC